MLSVDISVGRKCDHITFFDGSEEESTILVLFV